MFFFIPSSLPHARAFRLHKTTVPSKCPSPLLPRPARIRPARLAPAAQFDTGPESDSKQLFRKILLSPIGIPGTDQTIDSGYLVAGATATLLGGPGVALAFGAFLGLSLWLDTPFAFAAAAATVTSLLVDILRINEGMVPTGENPGTFLVPILVFALLTSATFGANPEDSMLGGPPSRMYREEEKDSMRNRIRNELNAQKEESGRPILEQNTSADMMPNDFIEWDERFIQNKVQEKQPLPEDK